MTTMPDRERTNYYWCQLHDREPGEPCSERDQTEKRRLCAPIYCELCRHLTVKSWRD